MRNRLKLQIYFTKLKRYSQDLSMATDYLLNRSPLNLYCYFNYFINLRRTHWYSSQSGPSNIPFL